MRWTSWTLALGMALGVLAACENGQPTAPAQDDELLRATGDAPTLARTPLPSGLVPAQGPPTLLLHADGNSDAQFFRDNLVATGQFSMGDIDISDGLFNGIPDLNQYACVYVWTNLPPTNPVAAGNALGAYAESGGTVILLTYALSRPDSPWEMQGEIMDPGYNPLQLRNVSQTSFPRSLDFSTAMTGHPFLNGVAEFTYGGNSNYVSPVLDAGATLVASDNFGDPLIAVNTAVGEVAGTGTVVGFNVYPGGAFSKSAGVWQAAANTCTQSAGEAPGPVSCSQAIQQVQIRLAVAIQELFPTFPPTLLAGIQVLVQNAILGLVQQVQLGILTPLELQARLLQARSTFTLLALVLTDEVINDIVQSVEACIEE